MQVFRGISPHDGERTIQQSVPIILDRAQEQRLSSRKWSLAELQLDEDDFAWLCDWAGNLSGRTAQVWLEDRPWHRFRIGSRECTDATALGTLLLLFASETARRKATEGYLWSIFQRDCFPTSTTHALYAGSQPTRAHKDALEAAARWLNLRHVFGIEGLQNWFDTVYLQFGFTHKGFQRRLPEWLVGQGRTQAIQHLLEGGMKSDTFRTLWDDLRNFRRKNMKADLVRTRLANNPWILPEWIEELLDQAIARIELGAGSETGSALADEYIEPFVSEPVLHWDPPTSPEFSCYVSNIAQFELTEPLYYVMINGQAYLQLQRSPDGAYVFQPSEEIVLPMTVPILVATLISSSGQVIASTPLLLWDANEEITAFRAASGKRIDAWKDMLRADAAYFLITASDVTLVPEPPYWHKLDKQGTTLSIINAGWPASLSLQLDGQLLWQPNMKDFIKGEEPRWTRSIDIALYDTAQQIGFGEVVRAIISHPDNVFISFVRLNSRPIDFTQGDRGSVITDPVVVSPDMLFHGTHLAELNFTIGVRNETTSVRITRAIRVEVVGAAMLSLQGWSALQPDMAMTVEQARTFPVQIFRSHIKSWALLEGDSWVGRPRPAPHPIGSLAGLGAPVKLRLGPYNAIEPDIPLVQEVVNRGIIANVRENHEREDFSYTIQLTYPIELDDHHEAIVWDATGQLHIGNPDYFLVQVRGKPSWILELPDSAPRPLVIAIAYDGVRLGAWWEDNWGDILQQIQDIHTIATMLRWFQLPILSNRDLPQLQQLVRREGSRMLPLWLSETPALPNLRWADEDDRWLAAIRTVFKNWRPGSMSSRKLVSHLGGTGEDIEELLTRTAWRLLRVDPLLMGKVLQPFVAEAYIPQVGARAAQALFRTLVSTLAGSTNEYEIQQQKKALLEAISDTMGYIDTNFIRRGLLEPALRLFQRKATKPLEEQNIALALGIEPFRRLLGIWILEYMAQSVSARR